jgi:ribosomal protein L11 methylase PrmA
LKKVSAIRQAFRNCRENIPRNHAGRIEIKPDTPGDISGLRFDRILANINLGILLSEAEQFSGLLNKEALIVMSGMVQEDCKSLEQKAIECGLQKTAERFKNMRAAMTFRKI